MVGHKIQMSWLYRAMNSIILSVLFLAMSLSQGYFSFLLKVPASVCCFGAFACIA